MSTTFLVSFKEGEPEGERFAHPQAQDLPAVQWKLHSVRKRKMKGKRKADALAKLMDLSGMSG